jgi:glycosyltransferase involved in cell wall biosynthesis
MITTVTVVMPAYNASQYLNETIESVLAQTFNDFELIIIDDGSTDNTAEVAAQYCQQDRRVKLFSQANQGVSVARNTGIKMAQGEFVAFIDADDQWLIDKLASHIKHLNLNDNLGISFGRVEFLSFDSKPTGKLSNAILSNLKPQHFLYENPTITVSNLVVRQEVFQQVGVFDESMKYNEDLDWCLRVMCSGNWNIEGINKVLMRYRTTEGGLSSHLYCMEKGWDLLIAKATQYAPELVARHYSKARAVHLRYLARRALRCSLPSQVGVDFMTRALRSDWELMLREPRRTLLTMLAVYGQHLMTNFIY